MLPSTDPKRLSNEEISREDAQISLRRGNRIHFLDGLGMSEDGNRRKQVRGNGRREY